MKTTLRAGRVHTVHGLEQLRPTAGSQLFLLSLQVAPAGAEPHALTLSELMADVEAALSGDTPRLDLLRWLVGEQIGYRPSEMPAPGDVEALVMRSAPVLVPVDVRCPALTATLLEPLGALAQRIADVRYTIDVEGLGEEDGSQAFLEVLP